ncbi:hypothetical protein lerEdw1_018680 [Lerista edwardsae]|nr:hypothetical protein lerEdw1_018680 [Lerista edwardsae]
MGKFLILLLLAVAFTASRGTFFNLDNGKICVQSKQCQSGCCQKAPGLSLAHCADKASEEQECSPQHIYGIYSKCPCEDGLTCEVDKTLWGTVTNTNFGTCQHSETK